MSLNSLDNEEKDVVRRAMAATFDYFTSDFSSRLGIEPEEMTRLLGRWPALDDSDDASTACIAINNSLNDLLNGEGISDCEALDKLGVSRDEAYRVYRKWAKARGWKHTGVM